MKNRPHIFYIGQLWEGGTCLERMKILIELGCQVSPFDTTPWLTGDTRLERIIANRTNYGRPVKALNRSLQEFSQTLHGITHLWIDKGRWIYPQTLSELKSRSGAMAIHYTPDPQLLLHRSRFFVGCIPIYDILITTKSYEIGRYKQAGAKDVMLVLQGYDDRFTRTVAPELWTDLDSDTCFIGHCERHYGQRLHAAVMSCDRLRIWGPRWRRYTFLHPWAKPYVAGNGLWGPQYPVALSRSKIALGLLSKRIPETTTTRTFEIPAAGAFLLAERTEDHLALFDEGAEAEFFGDDEELRDKILFYLREDHLRRRIARAGYLRCIKSGYHTGNGLKKVLEAVA
jgi:spore maturation protein CgeB